MTNTPQTIQIFLPGGDPQGIRIAEITTRIVQVIEVPRSMLSSFSTLPESSQVGLYFLIAGRAYDDAEPHVYIGQTGDLVGRLNSHHKEKEFWDRVLVLVSRTHSLTQTHAQYLEWRAIQAVRSAERYVCENGTGGNKLHTPAPMEADCEEIFATGRTLLATLGHPLFDPVLKPPIEGRTDDTLYYCRGSYADGRGRYTSEGFVVLQGSSGRRESVPSLIGTPLEKFRERLIESGILAVQGDRVVLTKDHLFSSPSMAAVALMGRTNNGWLNWLTEEGQTLDEIVRQPGTGEVK